MAADYPDTDLQDQLLKAMLDGRFEDFRELFHNPAVIPDFKYGKPHYSTCLEIACRHRDKQKFIELLLTRVKPTINKIVPEPIHLAAKNGNPEALEVLLKDKRVKVNVEDSSGWTALHYAGQHFNVEDGSYERCIKLLMSRSDIDINRPNKMGFTAIHLAARKSKQGLEAMLKYAKQDLDLDRYRGRGLTAREFIINQYPELVGSLPLPKSDTVHPQMQLLTALKNRYVDEFRVLLMQQDSNGKTVVDPNHWYGKPLNTTCLEMACHEKDCEDFVREAIQAGADPNIANRVNEKSPIHVAAEMGNPEALRVLLANKETDVNAVDKLGKTALHYAVDKRKVEVDLTSAEIDEPNKQFECVHILLSNMDIDINIPDNSGQSAVLLSVLCGNKDALKEILKRKIHNLDLDSATDPNVGNIRENITKVFPDLKDELPQPTRGVRKSPIINIRAMLFQRLYKRQEKEFVALLETNVENNYTLLEPDSTDTSLLQCASKNGLKHAVAALLNRDIDPNSTTSENKSPPVVLACENEHYDILQLFVKLSSSSGFDINATDMKGNSALHYAAWNRHLESVICLLNHGADISLENILGKPPIGAKDLEALLDECVTANDKFPRQEDYKVIFDYRLLASHSCKEIEIKTIDQNGVPLPMEETDLNDIINYGKPKAEMNLMSFISHSKDHKKLLKHPVALTFLELKWNGLRNVFRLNLGVYVLFLFCLNLHVFPLRANVCHTKMENNTILDARDNLRVFSSTRNKTNTNSFFMIASSIVLWVLSTLLIVLVAREMFQCVMSFKKYITNKEHYLDISIIMLTGWIIVFPSYPAGDIHQIIIILAILLSWTELLLLVGRISRYAKHIEMLKVVLGNYLSVSLFYSIIFMAFALSFHILLWNNTSLTYEDNWFDTFPMSILKTFIMMTGEFSAEKVPFEAMPVVVKVLFFLFVVLVTIVLFNLLIGLAVNDTQAIQKNAELLSLETRVKVALEIESIFSHYHDLLMYAGRRSTFMLTAFLFPAAEMKKTGEVSPNVGAYIKLSSRALSCHLDPEILEKAMKIIKKRMNPKLPENHVIKRLENVEESLKEVMTIVKELANQLLKNEDDTS